MTDSDYSADFNPEVVEAFELLKREDGGGSNSSWEEISPPKPIEEWQAVIGDKHCYSQGRSTEATRILKESILPLYKTNLPNHANTPEGRAACRKMALKVFVTILSEKFPQRPWAAHPDQSQWQPLILIHCSDEVKSKARVKVGMENQFKYRSDTEAKYGPASEQGIVHFFTTRLPKKDKQKVQEYHEKIQTMPFHCPAVEHFCAELNECKKLVFLQDEAIVCPEFHQASVRFKMNLLDHLWEKEKFSFNNHEWTLKKLWNESKRGSRDAGSGCTLAIPQESARLGQTTALSLQQPRDYSPDRETQDHSSPNDPMINRPSVCRNSEQMEEEVKESLSDTGHDPQPPGGDTNSSFAARATEESRKRTKRQWPTSDNQFSQPDSFLFTALVPNEATWIENALREIRESAKEDIFKLEQIQDLRMYRREVQCGIVTPRLTRLTSALIKASKKKRAATKAKILELIAGNELHDAAELYNQNRTELSYACKNEIGKKAHEVFDEETIAIFFEGGLLNRNHSDSIEELGLRDTYTNKASEDDWTPTAWTEQWAKNLIPKEERNEQDFDVQEYIEANRLDADRKVCVEYLKLLHRNFEYMGGEEMARYFPGRHLVDILSCTLEMDRAKARFFNAFDGRRGQHWYAEKHVDPRSDCFQEAWERYVSNYEGRPTISKRLVWLLDQDAFGLKDSRYTKLHKLLQPQKACWAGVEEVQLR